MTTPTPQTSPSMSVNALDVVKRALPFVSISNARLRSPPHPPYFSRLVAPSCPFLPVTKQCPQYTHQVQQKCILGSPCLLKTKIEASLHHLPPKLPKVSPPLNPLSFSLHSKLLNQQKKNIFMLSDAKWRYQGPKSAFPRAFSPKFPELHPRYLPLALLYQKHVLDMQKKGLAGNRTRDHSQHRLRVFKDAVRRPP